MKKKLVFSLLTMVLVGFAVNSAYAACPLTDKPCPAQAAGDEYAPPSPPWATAKDIEKMKKCHEKRKAEFDSRLKLTEEQKRCCEQGRMEARKQMKPIFEQMRAKKCQMQQILESSLSEAEKQQQVSALRAEIKCLKEQANKIREDNMKAFECSLNPEQKKELEKIKQEHKEKFKKMHKKFKGYGACPQRVGCPSQGPCPLNK